MIIAKAVSVLKAELSKAELIALAEALDGGRGDELLDALNEHLAVVAPEVFGDDLEFSKSECTCGQCK